MKTSQIRIYTLTACILLLGCAFAMTGTPARAATVAPVHSANAAKGGKTTVKVTAPAKVHSWVGLPVSVQIKAKDSDAAEKLTYSATGLPAGLSINPATGLISGTPQKLTADTVKVTATDGTGSSGSRTIKWLVGFAITIPDPGTVTTTVGMGLTVRLSYTDAISGDHVTLSATGLPAGVIFEQKPPAVYGWAVTAGTYHVVIHAHGSRGDISTMTFPVLVHPARGGLAGQLHLALGKCLTDPGNDIANGTAVTIANCGPGAAQRWAFWSDGTVRVHNRCLDIAGAGSSAGKGVQLWQCTGSPREAWTPGTAGELVNPASGLCLTDPGSSKRNGTVPTIGTCGVTPNATWTLPPLPILAAVPGKCVDDLHSVGTNGNVIDMYTCNGTPVQSWTFEPDGTLRIFGDKCITVHGAIGAVDAKIELWTCTAGNKAQQWTVVPTGGLSAELTLGGACLAVPSMSAADGSELVTASCTATDPRIFWHIW